MSFTDLLRGRAGLAGRGRPPGWKTCMGRNGVSSALPRHLAWPGMREFDVTDDRLRRSLYGIVLTQGRRNDLARFVDARLLRQDWPLLRASPRPETAPLVRAPAALRSLAAHGTGPARAAETEGNRDDHQS